MLQHSPVDNLQLGLAQMLENLQRAGAKSLPRGNTHSIGTWLADHGHSMVFDAPNVSSLNASAEVTTSAASELKSVAAARDAQAPVQPAPPLLATSGAWKTAQLKPADRLAALLEESKLVAACQRCPQLVCSRTKTVYGVGDVEARVVFVGEGPGADEDRQGIPFVGAAGQLLDKIITAMNLQREKVYIMNAVKCRPQNNRTPTDEEIANCQPFFIKQLEVIQPQFIVCLGAVASRAVLQTTMGIGKLRGKFYSYGAAQVVVTYHPAYLLRTPEAKKLTWDDMKMVMAAMKTN